MKLILIRHGQSLNNLLADTHHEDYDAYMAARSHEPPLTDVGQRQAEQIARYLAVAAGRPRAPSARLGWAAREHPITALYVSPMLRALQTAEPIGRALGVTPHVWVDIHEHGGLFSGNPEKNDVEGFPGLNRGEMAALFPEYVIAEDVTGCGWWQGGYEEWEACNARAERVAGVLREWSVQRQGETVALVTHGTFLDSLLHALILPDCDNRVHFSHLNTAMSRIDFRVEAPLAIRYLNRIDHLPPELVTR